MYLPTLFKSTDPQQTQLLIRQSPFATVITQDGPQLMINHLPILASDPMAPDFSLFGHMARSNPQWRHFADQDVTLIFNGPHTYITPRWYREADNVPTWNYAVVHVRGKARLVTEAEELDLILNKTVSQFEGSGPDAWEYRNPPEFKEHLMRGIVGFEITPTQIEAKFKMSQNRSNEDRQGVVDGLATRTDDQSRRVLQWMNRLQNP